MAHHGNTCAKRDGDTVLFHHHAHRAQVAIVHVNRLIAAHASERDMHKEHEDIFRAALDRLEARAALALDTHIRLTHDIVRLQASHAELN